MSKPEQPRERYRALTRQRMGYDGVLFDVQLQVADTGAIVWAQSFSDQQQADAFLSELQSDLGELDLATFRRKYGVPSSS